MAGLAPLAPRSGTRYSSIALERALLTAVYLRGVKSFETETKVRCSALTILTGSNSCGKSTVFQGVLLLKQLVSVPAGTEAIVRLSGPLVAQGSFRDWSSNHSEGPMALGVDFTDERGGESSLRIGLEATGGAPSDARLVSVDWSSGAVAPGTASSVGAPRFRWSLNVTSIDEYAKTVSDLLGAKVADAPASEGALIPTTGLPYHISAFITQDGREARLGDAIGSLSGLVPARISSGSAPKEALLWLLERLQAGAPTAAQPPADLVDLGNPSRLASELGRVFHLGPLREEPRLIYSGERARNPQDVGPRGEKAASVLAEFGGEIIDVPLPDLSPGVTHQTLLEAVAEWGERIGVLSKLQALNETKFGTEFRVSAPFSASSPAAPAIQTGVVNVGIGISQVIPVLVLCLAAPPGSTVLIEQPELHLHPAVQSRLGDFFAACILSGRQIVVETHSEHIINRVRLLTARNQLAPSSDVCLHFIERDDFGSEVSEIAIRKDGGLERWPRGFFDETSLALEELVRARLS